MLEKATQSWSIIVLCYNEEGTIERVIKDAQENLAVISTSEGEIVLVNDGSTDKSDEIIQSMLTRQGYANLKYVCHETNKGIGEALHTGYANSTGDNVVMVPGDGQFDLGEFVEHKNIPENSILAFYRLENTSYSLSRNFLAWMNKTLNKTFIGLNLKDVNWVKVYKNEALKKLNLEIRSSLIESEICSKLIYTGHQPIEVKSKYLIRQSGESKGASFKIAKLAFMDVIRLIRVFRRFKRKMRKRNS